MKTRQRAMVLMAALAMIGAHSGRAAESEVPRIMLLIEEKNLGSIPTAEVEAMATRLLLREDVNVVDQEMVKANTKKDQQLLRMAGDPRGAAAVGLQFGADIIIVGDAVAKPSAGRIAGSNMRTYEAITTLRAIRTDTSTTLASASKVGTAIGINDISGSSRALQASGTAAFETLVPAMLAAWREGGTSGGGRSIEITYGGIDATWVLSSVRTAMKESPHVSRVIQRQYTPGAAIFEVVSDLPAQELAEHLILHPPKRLRFQILNVSARKMNVRVVRTDG